MKSVGVNIGKKNILIKNNTPGTIFNVVEGAKSQITVKDVDANL
jgi:hypothetical protein